MDDISSLQRIDFSPRGYFLEYPLFVNYAISKYIEEFQNSSFKQKRDGTFVLKRMHTMTELTTLFDFYLQEVISETFCKIDKENPIFKNKVYIIADSGDLRRKEYTMLETDIDVHLKKWEKASKSLFNKFFTKKRCVDNYHVVWCKHNMLLALDWMKICKGKVFGKKNVERIKLDVKKDVVKETLFDNVTLTTEQNKLIIAETEDWLRKEI